MTSHAIPYEKYHGTGNDFLIVDATAFTGDRRRFAQRHCDRESGVRATGSDRRGADGVLFLTISEDAEPIRVTMTLIQPDGSAAAMCGNGARCVAEWVSRRTGATEVVIDTPAGPRLAQVHSEPGTVTIEMGHPSFDPDDVPLAGAAELINEPAGALADVPRPDIRFTAVGTGVPHAVGFVDDVDHLDVDALAEPVRHAERFPQGANVNLAAPVSGSGLDASAPSPTDTVPIPTFRQRTFERGVESETRSCGTGAVAIAAVAKRLGRTNGDRVRTRPPGGELIVEIPETGPATLTGPVTRESVGKLPTEKS